MPVNVNGIPVTLGDGIRETTQTTGTGTYSLDGPATVSGITYRTFVAVVGSGTVTLYTVRLGSQFEIGIGTVTSGAPPTLTRSSIVKSSNANNPVIWGVGTKDIMCGAPADLFHSLQSAIDTAPYANRFKTTVLTSTGAFTRDVDCLWASVRIVGGGGAGGGNPTVPSGQAAEGGGGGGGEYAEGLFTAAQIGASAVTVTIGAGGTGVSAGAGNSGGTTSFGSLMSAAGGAGGLAGIPETLNNSIAGGAGGSGGAGGMYRVQGSWGDVGQVRQGLRMNRGGGGASILGSDRSITTQAAAAGAAYGSGGTRASSDANDGVRTGGAGAPGVCIVVEFCKV